MIDQLVDQTERVSADVERVAAINEAQTTQIRDIDETVQRLGDDDDDRDAESGRPVPESVNLQ